MGDLNIVILGAGSIGCYLGGLLASAGSAVRFLGRARYAKALAGHGLTLTHFSKPPIHIAPENVDFQTGPEALAGADVILLCTKSGDSADAAAQINAFAPSDAIVVSFQNGISNADVLRDTLNLQRVLPAIVPFNVTSAGAGIFHCGTAGALVIAASADARIKKLKDAFEAAGQDVRHSDNIIGDQWAKMIVNLNNGLNTLSGGTLRAGLLQRDYRRALALLVEEALLVAKLNDVKMGTFNGRGPDMLLKTLRLPNLPYRLIMQLIVKIDAKARSSMLDDLDAGRVSEIDYLQGEIVARAAAVGTLAPHNRAIMDAVKMAFIARQSPNLSGGNILGLITEKRPKR